MRTEPTSFVISPSATLLEAMHRQLWDVMPYVPLGQFKQPFLWRKNITGVLRSNNVVYWNIDKT